MSAQGIFVTGTDTEVGKTFVVCLLARLLRQSGRRVGAYKPVCSGAERDESDQPYWPDVDKLLASVGGSWAKDRLCPQRFQPPLAPPVAARLENRRVDRQALRDGAAWWLQRVDVLLVEGVGGLLCPLTETETVADLAVDLAFPLLVVARNALGTINHTLLTVEAARRRGLSVAAVVLNDGPGWGTDQSAQTNGSEIAARAAVPVVRVQRDGQQFLTLDGQPAGLDWLPLHRTGQPREPGLP